MCEKTVLIRSIINGSEFFMELLTFISKYADNINISLWGDLPEDVKLKLRHFERIKRTFRMRVVKEFEYKIKSQELKAFIPILKLLNMNSVSWGIGVDGDCTVLFRSPYDVIFNCHKMIPESEIESFFQRLQVDGHIGGSEIITEKE